MLGLKQFRHTFSPRPAFALDFSGRPYTTSLKRSKPFFTCLWRLLSAMLIVVSTALVSPPADSAAAALATDASATAALASLAVGNAAWKLVAYAKTDKVCLG